MGGTGAEELARFVEHVDGGGVGPEQFAGATDDEAEQGVGVVLLGQLALDLAQRLEPPKPGGRGVGEGGVLDGDGGIGGERPEHAHRAGGEAAPPPGEETEDAEEPIRPHHRHPGERGEPLVPEPLARGHPWLGGEARQHEGRATLRDGSREALVDPERPRLGHAPPARPGAMRGRQLQPVARLVDQPELDGRLPGKTSGGARHEVEHLAPRAIGGDGLGERDERPLRGDRALLPVGRTTRRG